MGLVVHSGAETEKANCSEDGSDNHQRKSEFGFVDALVFLGQAKTDVVVQRAREELADDGEDERRQAYEACLADGEVVGC